MTYNFDPERWCAIECDALEAAFYAGRLDKVAYEKAQQRLQERLDSLWDRLDGSYQLPDDQTR